MAPRKKHEDIISAVTEELKEKPGVLDEEFEPGEELRFFPGRRKTADEVAIDEMLIDLKGNDWYLKLSKEVTPNEFQFKKRITQFRHWADMEYEINMLVRAETEAEYKRIGRNINWGSGRYMITFFRNGGLRGGEKKQPVLFNIDAQEREAVQQTDDKSVEILREVLSRQQAIPPQDIVRMQTETFTKGLEAASAGASKSEAGSNAMITAMMTLMGTIISAQANSTATMVQAMMGNKPALPPPVDPVQTMSGLMGVLTPFIGKQTAGNEPTTLVEQVRMLKDLGIIKNDNSDDPSKQFERMQQFMNLALGFARATEGERPGLLEQIITSMGPKFGEAIVNVSGAIKSGFEAKKAGILTSPATVIPSTARPILPGGRPVAPRPSAMTQDFDIEADSNVHIDMNAMDRAEQAFRANMHQRQQQQQEVEQAPIPNEEDAKAEMIARYSEQLYGYVASKNYNAFPEITKIADGLLGGPGQAEARIRSGQVSADMLVGYVIMLDGKRYPTPQAKGALHEYISKYVASFFANEGYPVTCSTCGTENLFKNEEHFASVKAEEGQVKCNADGCEGILG